MTLLEPRLRKLSLPAARTAVFCLLTARTRTVALPGWLDSSFACIAQELGIHLGWGARHAREARGGM